MQVALANPHLVGEGFDLPNSALKAVSTQLISDIFPFQEREARFYLTLGRNLAAIGELYNARCVPLVFPLTLVGPSTDAMGGVAIIRECSRILTESPALGTARVGYRGKDCPKSRRRPFPSHLPENITCWAGTVDERGEVEQNSPSVYPMP